MARASKTDARELTLFEVGPAPAPPAALYAEVALNRPVVVQFTYSVPDELSSRVVPGVRVAVPFGAEREVGVVTAIARECALERVRPIAALLDEEPLVSADLLALTRWIGERYACSWGEALHAVLPAALKRERESAKVIVASPVPGIGAQELAQLEEREPKQHRMLRTLIDIGGRIELRELCRKLNLSDSAARTLHRRGWIRLEKVEVDADELETSRASRPRPTSLHPAQQAALTALLEPLLAGRHGAFLLQGVTGSGKTEVYLALIERALALGRGAIVLVPEIALTPQTVGWFRARFENVAVLHSRMTDAQRLRMWRRVQRGEARVVVGARSALFAPMDRIGVIVVDEEHEPSFKQGSTPRYHARDVAIERARESAAVCVLGSATPSLESWSAAQVGTLTRLSMPERISGHGFPVIEVVDIRSEPSGPQGHKLFSRRLLLLLREALERGEQAILFQNRRGFAPVLWCPGCKETLRCKRCDVALAWHQRIGRMVCHSCCEERRSPKACPVCTRPGMRFVGAGSERIELEIQKVAPQARVRRMDSDTMRRREDYEDTLSAFGRGEIDVLVGTQMIAKGLDFPRVTVVGIISADGALHLPDFRAAERTFQLISQVAGRAGRGDLPGRIVVQTMSPQHPSIVRAAAHDHDGFARHESALRAELGYPPHGRLLRLLYEDPSEKLVIDASDAAGEFLREKLADSEAVVLGPAPAPIAMVRERHRRHLLLKFPSAAAQVEQVLAAVRKLGDSGAKLRATVDVDPVSLF
ncbi:MAG: primosomal protein N' [Planctomycetes bacterium]|nr:primosomal protein N' [Planctomycetota bacterium]